MNRWAWTLSIWMALLVIGHESPLRAQTTTQAISAPSPMADSWGDTPMQVRQVLNAIQAMPHRAGPDVFDVVWLEQMARSPADYGLSAEDQAWLRATIDAALAAHASHWSPRSVLLPATIMPSAVHQDAPRPVPAPSASVDPTGAQSPDSLPWGAMVWAGLTISLLVGWRVNRSGKGSTHA